MALLMRENQKVLDSTQLFMTFTMGQAPSMVMSRMTRFACSPTNNAHQIFHSSQSLMHKLMVIHYQFALVS